MSPSRSLATTVQADPSLSHMSRVWLQHLNSQIQLDNQNVLALAVHAARDQRRREVLLAAAHGRVHDDSLRDPPVAQQQERAPGRSLSPRAPRTRRMAG